MSTKLRTMSSGFVIRMNDVAFSMRLVNTDTKLRIYQPLMRLATWVQDCVSLSSGSIACMNDVASLMRLVNTGIELRIILSNSYAISPAVTPSP